MDIDKIVDSKVITMTNLSGKKSKVLFLKNETEIEAFKEQLALLRVSCQREQLKAFGEIIAQKMHNGEEFNLTKEVENFISL